MLLVIDSITPNQGVRKVLDEIDTLVEFSGKKPEKVALFPAQFDRVKHGCLVALRRKLRSELKELSGGGRLKSGQLKEYLDANGYASKEQVERISYKGIVLYNKAEHLN